MDVEKLNTSERGQKSRAVLAKSAVNGVSQDQACFPSTNSEHAGNNFSFKLFFLV